MKQHTDPGTVPRAAARPCAPNHQLFAALEQLVGNKPPLNQARGALKQARGRQQAPWLSWLSKRPEQAKVTSISALCTEVCQAAESI